MGNMLTRARVLRFLMSFLLGMVVVQVEILLLAYGVDKQILLAAHSAFPAL